MRVLIAEDEIAFAAVVARRLRREGMAVDVALDGERALRRIDTAAYDVVVLDRNLPAVHGDEVCRRADELGCEARILMLTASGELEDRVAGLNLGADDYLAKPVALDELVARIRALARRNGSARSTVIRRGDIELDSARRTVTKRGAEIALTTKEFAVLEALLVADGAVLSADQLLRNLWDGPVETFANTVRVTVMRLRRKLGEPSLIETVVGAGYRVR